MANGGAAGTEGAVGAAVEGVATEGVDTAMDTAVVGPEEAGEGTGVGAGDAQAPSDNARAASRRGNAWVTIDLYQNRKRRARSRQTYEAIALDGAGGYS